MDATKQSLQTCIVKIIDATIIHELLNLFEGWVCYFKEKHPNKRTPFNNKEGAEAMLLWLFKDTPEDIFIYLKTKKDNFINK